MVTSEPQGVSVPALKSKVPRPSFAATVQYMLHSGEFAMAPAFGQGLPTYEVLWDSRCGPAGILLSEVQLWVFVDTN